MAKCEEALKGVQRLKGELDALCEEAKTNDKREVSLEIRVRLISLIRCLWHYGDHLGAFVLKEPKQLPRMTYLEKQREIEV